MTSRLQPECGVRGRARPEAEGIDHGEPGGGIGVLGVDADEIGAGFGELRGLGFENCVLHHEMDVKGLGREFPQGGDEIGEEQQGRREMAIRDIDVEDIGESSMRRRCAQGSRDRRTRARFRP